MKRHLLKTFGIIAGIMIAASLMGCDPAGSGGTKPTGPPNAPVPGMDGSVNGPGGGSNGPGANGPGANGPGANGPG